MKIRKHLLAISILVVVLFSSYFTLQNTYLNHSRSYRKITEVKAKAQSNAAKKQVAKAEAKKNPNQALYVGCNGFF